jgi:hypothetical protein
MPVTVDIAVGSAGAMKTALLSQDIKLAAGVV